MTNDEAIYVLKNTAFLGWSEQAEKVSEAVRMAVEALKRETSGDAIDRQAAIRIASGYCHPANIAKELAKLPPVQPVGKDINVSCKDAISRQGAIDALTEYGNGRAVYISVEEAVRRIEQLLSAQPEIIHCKDCKWFGDIGCAIEIVDDSDKPSENDFCSFAGRRTDERMDV